MLKRVLRITDLLGKGAYYLSAILIVFIGAAVIYEVFFRAATSRSLPWVTEFSGYLLAGVIFFLSSAFFSGHPRCSLINQ